MITKKSHPKVATFQRSSEIRLVLIGSLNTQERGFSTDFICSTLRGETVNDNYSTAAILFVLMRLFTFFLVLFVHLSFHFFHLVALFFR